MQVSIETVSGLERRMTVGVPADQVDNEVNDRLVKAAKTVRLDGFRPGKVPMKVLRQRYGAGVRQEVVGEVVNKHFADALKQEDVRPAGQPSIEFTTDKAGETLEFVASFEVYPDITLSDFSAIEVERPVAEVNDADLDKMIEVLREQNSEWRVVERAAEKHDQVNLDYTGRRDGEEFEGGNAEGSDLELGSGQMIAGFEGGLVGMSAGETKTLALAFPDDYHSEDLKGAAVEFDVKINDVQEKTLPDLDDAFFAKFNVEDGDLEKFRDEVRNNMERELRNAVKNKTKTRLMAQLEKLHSVEMPQALVSGEISALKQQMMQQFGGGQNQGIDESMLPDEIFRSDAEKRVALGLIVAAIVEQENIKVDPERVSAQIEELASTYEDPKEVISYYYSNEQMLNSVHAGVLEDQVVEHVLAGATVTDEVCDYETAVKPDEPEAVDKKSDDGSDEESGETVIDAKAETSTEE